MATNYNKQSVQDLSSFIKRMTGNNEYFKVAKPYLNRGRLYAGKVYRANTFIRSSTSGPLAHVDMRSAVFRHNSKVALKYGVAGVAIGMTAYGLTSYVGRRRKTKVGRAFNRTSYAFGRVASVPAHFAYGGIKGALSPMSSARVFDVRAGASRALKSAEGYNPVTNRKNTYRARTRRTTISHNRRVRGRAGHNYQAVPPKLTKAQRQQMARRRRRVHGRFA